MKVAVIGGGAAGLMAAISVAEHHSGAEVSVFERSGKFLSKVKVSGGGRCNVMHQPKPVSELLKAYPRGTGILKKTLPVMDPDATLQWFENHGVKLKTEPDGRMFPVTDSSQTIMDCLLNTARSHGVRLIKKFPVTVLKPTGEGLWEFGQEGNTQTADKVIVATGGSPKPEGYDWLVSLGHQVVPPVPSLFSFNIRDAAITDLQGVVAPAAEVTVAGTRLKDSGPLLITHWGISGPAVLKLSAFGARELAELQYRFEVAVNWINIRDQARVKSELEDLVQSAPHKSIGNTIPGDLPRRLWHYILGRASVQTDKRNGETGGKSLNRIVEYLCNDRLTVDGRTAYKEEFVTAGGVSADAVKLPSLESKVCPGLYFCGEVLDMDGITGGYNFQAAWTTGYVAGQLR